jgi:hypothetical protein
MKTLKITAVLSMIFLFAGFVSAYSANRVDNKGTKPASVVRYQVTIHIPADIDLCSAYQVLLVDGHGIPVAPPQGFIPGNNTYVFTESASTAGARGVRMIQNSELLHYICANELNTAPVFHTGPFMTGQTYSFELFPLIKNDPRPKTENTPKE